MENGIKQYIPVGQDSTLKTIGQQKATANYSHCRSGLEPITNKVGDKYVTHLITQYPTHLPKTVQNNARSFTVAYVFRMFTVMHAPLYIHYMYSESLAQ